MVINLGTTSISFYPFVSFESVTSGGETSYLVTQNDFYIITQDGNKLITAEGSSFVNVEVWHKNTKVMVSDLKQPVEVGSRISVDLPSLTPIADVAQNLDVVLIRIYNLDTLLWEYLATWSDESTNINKTFKHWDTTSNISPEWITL
jgi:hypothetical protein